jgi:hypothetical protein
VTTRRAVLAAATRAPVAAAVIRRDIARWRALVASAGIPQQE